MIFSVFFDILLSFLELSVRQVRCDSMLYLLFIVLDCYVTLIVRFCREQIYQFQFILVSQNLNAYAPSSALRFTRPDTKSTAHLGMS